MYFSLTLDYGKYITIYKDYGNNPLYKRECFGRSTDNWLNFQPSVKSKDTFLTTAQVSFMNPKNMTSPFQLRDTNLTRNKQKLEEYRSRWSRGHADYPRTYLGAIPFKKADKEE